MMLFQKSRKSFPSTSVPMHPYKKEFEEIWKSCKRMFQKSRVVQWTTALSVFFLVATTALPIWRILPLAAESPFIALHYNIYLGIDRLGPISHIFFLPALGLLFLVVNLSIQAWGYRTQKTLSLFFAASNPFLQFILLGAMSLIVLINV